MGFLFIASMLAAVFLSVLGIVATVLGFLLTASFVVIGAAAIGYILYAYGRAFLNRKQGGQIQLASDDDDDSINTVIANDLEAQNELTPKVPGYVAQS
jgi:membrane protein implicated in regulation of membrane protease activity